MDTGKFISADTIIPRPGNLLAWDRYGYAYNNPVSYNDPSGQSGKFFETCDPQELVLTPL